MVDFAEIADLISDAVTDEGLGETVVLTTVTAGAYDPVTGVTTPSTTTASVQATIEEYEGAELIAGLAAAGDKKVSIPAAQLSAAPKPTDKVTVATIVYAVVSVRTERAGGVDLLYVLQCRKA